MGIVERPLCAALPSLLSLEICVAQNIDFVRNLAMLGL